MLTVQNWENRYLFRAANSKLSSKYARGARDVSRIYQSEVDRHEKQAPLEEIQWLLEHSGDLHQKLVDDVACSKLGKERVQWAIIFTRESTSTQCGERRL